VYDPASLDKDLDSYMASAPTGEAPAAEAMTA
jgi:hypothetical protein